MRAALLALAFLVPFTACGFQPQAEVKAHVSNTPYANDGTPVQVDLPKVRHRSNKSGTDGLGLCVFTSIGMAADWHDVEILKDFRDWMTHHPGGGYPSKVSKMISQKCGSPDKEPEYIQVQGGDLDILAKACANGHMVGVTYSRSPTGRYNGMKIAHMVDLVAARAGPNKLWAILDNNYINTIEWMTEEDFRRSYCPPNMRGEPTGWGFIFLEPGPFPVPHMRGEHD